MDVYPGDESGGEQIRRIPHLNYTQSAVQTAYMDGVFIAGNDYIHGGHTGPLHQINFRNREACVEVACVSCKIRTRRSPGNYNTKLIYSRKQIE
jgi:hypothetical protein